MGLVSSGEIKVRGINQTRVGLADEYNAPGQVGLSDFYRGGANVPDWSGTTSVPLSGEIQLSDFHGTGAFDLQLTGRASSFSTSDPIGGGNSAYSGWRFMEDFVNAGVRDVGGLAISGSIPTGTEVDQWVNQPGFGGSYNYEIKCTQNSGDTLDSDSDSLGSFLTLAIDRAWAVSRTTVGTSVANLTVEIREIGNITNTVSATFTCSSTIT